MKRFTGHAEPWGTFLDVKSSGRRSSIPQRYAGKELFLGSVTDPYLPQEEQYGRTRALLEQLQGSGAKLSIATKSDLILRDLDLIQNLPGCPRFMVCQYAGRGFQKRYGQRREHRTRRLAAMEAFHQRGHPHDLFCFPHIPRALRMQKAIIRRVQRASAI